MTLVLCIVAIVFTALVSWAVGHWTSGLQAHNEQWRAVRDAHGNWVPVIGVPGAAAAACDGGGGAACGSSGSGACH